MDASPAPTSPFAALSAMLAATAVLAAPVLLVLGSVLKATTHHRALGGTTFAVIALGVGAGCLAFGARLGNVAGRWAGTSPGRARLVTIASASLVVGVLAGLAQVAARTPRPPPRGGAEATEHGP